MASVTALTFHQVVDDPAAAGNGDPAVLRYMVSRRSFVSYLEEISDGRCYTLREFVRPVDADGLILTFDDGYQSDYRTVFPLLVEKGLKGTFFLTAENLGQQGYLSAAQAREMAEAGNEIASHGMTHRYLVNMPRAEAVEEICRSKEMLEQSLGLSVTSYAPVGGHYRTWMIDQVRKDGYTALATMIPGLNRQPVGGFVLLRRNHLQAHHDADYFLCLLRGDRGIMLRNRIRYEMLHGIQRALGLRRYDRFKALLFGARNRGRGIGDP